MIEKNFYSDIPITSSDDDQLDRGGFAKILAQTLIKLNSPDTFTVGLYGKWGSGKTSIVNMTLDEITEQEKDISEKDRFIAIHFEPWNFSDSDQLLSQFFLRLANEFRSKKDKCLTKIGEALETYSDALDSAKAIPRIGWVFPICRKILAKAGKKMKKDLDENDILQQKNYVMDLLKQQEKKILVVIDDIDRLNNEQIRQIFQLITSVAKFPNTIYLLVFDKEIVVKALEKVQEGDGEEYLEKIIQMPIEVPRISREKLREVLHNKLNTILIRHENIGFAETRWNQIYRSCVDPYITNIRDINRLCNSVQFKSTTIYTEIDFTDMVAISVLEIYFPQIYEWVKENKSILTGQNYFSAVGGKTPKDWYELYLSEIKTLLPCKNKEMQKKEAEVAITFLSCLFPYFGNKIGENFEVNDLELFLKNNQIAHPKKFDRYFHLDLDNIGLKKAEIKNAIFSLNCDEFSEYLLSLDKRGTSYGFLEEVKAAISEIPSDRAKMIIQTLFSTSTLLSSASDNVFRLPSSSHADRMIIDLLDVIPTTDRFVIFIDAIHNADLISLQSIANVIHMLELGFGRLTDDGIESDFKKVLSLEELIDLEDIFIRKVKVVLEKRSLFDFKEWRIIAALLGKFDSEFTENYLVNALREEKNIVRYLDESVGLWRGSDISYSIEETYKEYLTEERVLEAIESQKISGDLFLMPEQVQNKCGAFFLHVSGNTDYSGRVVQSDVDKLLETWKNQCC